ncbi:MAG: DUF72 domain-containing protein [Acidiferrobacterales bacterium]
MAEPLLVGTYGWEYDSWVGSFYPPQLPDEWRFCYYSNRLRSVLLPADFWRSVGADTAKHLLQDTDPEFRFVLELPAILAQPLSGTALRSALDEFRKTVAQVRAQTAGILVRVSASAASDLDWFSKLLQSLAADLPVCADLPATHRRTTEALQILDSAGAGLCWHLDHEKGPRPGGRFLVGRSSSAEPEKLRRMIDAVTLWRTPDSAAGLFFDGENAPRAAQDARIIAELLEA